MKRREWAAVSAAFLVAGIGRWSGAQTPPPAAEQPQAAAADTSKTFTAAELDQLLAPIALYPDPLLAQILMAATYPLEVIEAAHWSKDNPKLTGDAALAAVKDKGWDVSVTSLVAFPQVLAMMDSKLEWTQKVGDAMLAQQPDVAASIQRLRAQAQAAGTLKTTPQQTVSSQPPSTGAPDGTPAAIVIQPTNPDTIYVPTYDPNVAYGPWPYASNPPYYYPPASYGWSGPSTRVGGFGFGLGFAVGGAFFGGWHWGGGWGGGWGWGGWHGWGRGNSYTTINIDRATYISNTFNRNYYDHGRWNHDPAHRHGVPYRDRGSRDRYNQHHANADGRNGYRGHDGDRGDDGRGGDAGRGNDGRGGDAGRGNDGRGGDAGRGNDGRGGDAGRGNDGRGGDAGRGNDGRGGGHSDQHRNAFHGADHGHQVQHEAQRGRSYANHGSHGGWHGGGGHGGGGHGGGHGGGGHGGRR
ncbi:MAG: DUF3300 domain-containing protein [Rhodospirillales bacterium]|nr:DUF3300 domain-containing protein [Rhodospirillales bacterium]